MNATADRTQGPSTLSQGPSDRSAVVVSAYGPDDSRHIRTRDPAYAEALAIALRAVGYRVEIEEEVGVPR